MTRHLLAVALLLSASTPALAWSVNRTFSYFSIGGTTLADIENELNRLGPLVGTSNRRHPGATRLEFTTRVTYSETDGRCSVSDANVTVNANVILPRWRRPRSADGEVQLVWETLERDIRRHEESHIVIARNHARELELAIKAIRPQANCDAAAERVQTISADVMQRHDEEQARFDRIEAINFESRMLQLLSHRLEQMDLDN